MLRSLVHSALLVSALVAATVSAAEPLPVRLSSNKEGKFRDAVRTEVAGKEPRDALAGIPRGM